MTDLQQGTVPTGMGGAVLFDDSAQQPSLSWIEMCFLHTLHLISECLHLKSSSGRLAELYYSGKTKAQVSISGPEYLRIQLNPGWHRILEMCLFGKHG